MTQILKKGSTGLAVMAVQSRLHLIEDGIFGPLTEEAVRDFQRERGVEPDGIVTPELFECMNQGMCRLVKSRRNISMIIVHCSATPEGKDVSVESIRSAHKAQGWSDIGYHYVITLSGDVKQGRNVDLIGAHCQGKNTNSIGVCYVGGVDKDGKPKDTRTERQRIQLKQLLIQLLILYPGARIYGHRDFANKACPSFDATKEYKELRPLCTVDCSPSSFR